MKFVFDTSLPANRDGECLPVRVLFKMSDGSSEFGFDYDLIRVTVLDSDTPIDLLDSLSESVTADLRAKAKQYVSADFEFHMQFFKWL